MNEIFNPINIVLLAIAVVVIFRLWSVLGQRTGNERSDLTRFSKPEPATEAKDRDNVVPLPRPGSVMSAPGAPSQELTDRLRPVSAESRAYQPLADIATRDPSFETSSFLKGANTAYEMIVTSYAHGDRETLRRLLSPEVFDSFNGSIAEREARGEATDFSFVGITSSAIVDAHLAGRLAQITVEFVSELVTATKDRYGEVIDGDDKAVQQVIDVWTFSRDIGSSNPNWLLVATAAPA